MNHPLDQSRVENTTSRLLFDDGHTKDDDQILMNLLANKKATARRDSELLKTKTVTFADSENSTIVNGQQQYQERIEVDINKRKKFGVSANHSRGDDNGDDRYHEQFSEYKGLLSETNKRISDLDKRMSHLSKNVASKEIEVQISQYFEQFKEEIKKLIQAVKTGFEKETLAIEHRNRDCGDSVCDEERTDYEKTIATLNDRLQKAQDEIQTLHNQLDSMKMNIHNETEFLDDQMRNEELNKATQSERESLLIMAKQLSNFSHEVTKRAIESERKLAAAEEKEIGITREKEKLESERAELESAKNMLSNLKMDIVRHRIVLLKSRRDA